MTVLDPSDPKLQPNYASSSVPTEDLLPIYSIEEITSTSSTPFIESISTLNPESSKKLAHEARERGEDIENYGFEYDTAEMPPPFSQNESRPSYTISSDGNIISHDENLNSSPIALARFLRLHASNSSPPSLSVQIRGSHTERRTSNRFETDGNGNRRVKTETKEVEVEDFDFNLDARKEVELGLGKARGGGVRGCMFTAGEFECAHRGGSWRSIGVKGKSTGEGRIRLPSDAEEARGGVDAVGWKIAGFWEQMQLDKEKKSRSRRGLPSFVHPDSLVELTESNNNPSPPLLFQSHFLDLVENHSSVPFSMTGVSAGDPHITSGLASLIAQRDAREEEVRQVIEEYCLSPKTLKQLSVTKETYGWNFEALEEGIRSIIESTRYTGKLSIHFKSTPTSLVIRPQNALSQIFSQPIWIKIILWITLVYPVLLAIEFFAGDRYDNLRVSFPLVRWRVLPLPSSLNSCSSSSGLNQTQALAIAKPLTSRSVPIVAQLPNSRTWVYLIGTEEREWLSSWERGIVEAVRRGRRGGELSEGDRVTE